MIVLFFFLGMIEYGFSDCFQYRFWKSMFEDGGFQESNLCVDDFNFVFIFDVLYINLGFVRKVMVGNYGEDVVVKIEEFLF